MKGRIASLEGLRGGQRVIGSIAGRTFVEWARRQSSKGGWGDFFDGKRQFGKDIQ